MIIDGKESLPTVNLLNFLNEEKIMKTNTTKKSVKAKKVQSQVLNGKSQKSWLEMEKKFGCPPADI